MATYYATSDGLKTFMVVDENTVYQMVIELDAEQQPDHYSHCGLSDLTESQVDMFVETDEEHYLSVCDDVDDVNRVGRKPVGIPPPQH